MNMHINLHNSVRSVVFKWNRRLRRIATTSLLVLGFFALGQSAYAAVAVDQSPLIIQKAIPPNLVLMLDDSDSMGWNFMPDTASGVNSATNGVYYDPNTYYEPPKHADGSYYPSATFPMASTDGFAGGNTRNIQTYSNGWKYYRQGTTNLGNNKGNCGNNDKYNCVFRYDDPATGTEHYVGESCAGFSNCHLDTDTLTLQTVNGTPITTTYGQNVADWFSYYQTRILMAKTALTLAFSSLDPDIRVGFGSINGNGSYWIRQNLPYTTENNKTIANVKKFGDGSAGSQKADFWTWITDQEYANSGTPLRLSLQAVGKYYETLQPWQSTETVGGVTTTSAYACRPAYAILTTDGFWNGSSPNVGNVDNSTQTAITSPSYYQYTATAPFKDSTSNTLADVAMEYWAKDLRTDINNEVPSSPSDPAYWQHMTTFTIGLGWDPAGLPAGLTMKDIFDWAHTGNPPTGSTYTANSNIWPAPDGALTNITDLAHAAVNGHGNFFNAKNPAQFVTGLQSALDAIGAQNGAGSAITLSDTTTATTNTLYRFRGTYRTQEWTGVLAADVWDPATSAYVTKWDANNNFPTAADRNIWTVDKASTGTGSQVSVAFKLDTGNNLPAISTAEKAGLSYYSGGILQTQVSQATILNYLRGDKTYEKSNGGDLRDRTAVLGDIVSSTPVYVAAPNKDLFNNASFPGASTYGNFVKLEFDRTPLVYVAANDGMLHVFRVEQGLTSGGSPDPSKPGGQEVYAYMPGAVLRQPANSAGGISNIANPEYGKPDGVTGLQAVPHQYYNDGRITTQNVYMDTGDGNGLSWHTILVGTTGRGPAKAVYALDITDPSVLMDPAKSAKALLWERSAGDSGACTGAITANCSNYIGEMTGAPVIAQIQQNGTTSVTNPPKWAVFLGNGYNSSANKAALLQFDLKTGALDVHTVGSGGGNVDNGLAEPGLRQPDSNNGESTEAYAGDLYGNVWQFDLKNANSVGQSVFVAKDANGNTQPITSLIALDYDSTTNSTWAFFGTGKYLSSADITNTQVQTWYGLRVDVDVPQTTPATPIPSNTPIVSSSTTRSDLTQRTIVNQQASSTAGDYLRATSQQSVATDMNGKAGWYMDLTYDTTTVGERIVNRTQFIAGYAVVTTLIPKVSDPCNTVPAGAYMIVDPFTGANLAADIGLGSYAVTVGGVIKNIPFNGLVLQDGPAAGVTGSYNADGTVSLTSNTLGGGVANPPSINPPGAQAGRVSWRELFN